MDSVFVKPAPGGRIRQPERNNCVMPETGALVPRNNYYERLILTEDVVETDPPEAPKAKTQPDPASPSGFAGTSPQPAPEKSSAALSIKD